MILKSPFVPQLMSKHPSLKQHEPLQGSVVVKNRGLGSQQIRTWCQHFSIAYPPASDLTSLCLSFLVCTKGIIVAPTSQGCLRMGRVIMQSVLLPCPESEFSSHYYESCFPCTHHASWSIRSTY